MHCILVVKVINFETSTFNCQLEFSSKEGIMRFLNELFRGLYLAFWGELLW